MNSTLITMKFISQINRPLLIKICWLTINLAAITSFNGQAFSMTFSLEERCDAALNPQCQRMVIAQGPINTQSFAQFKELTKDMPSGTWIAKPALFVRLLITLKNTMGIKLIGMMVDSWFHRMIKM